MNLVKRYMRLPKQKKIALKSRLTMIYNLLWGIGKVILGIFVNFDFMWVSGLYSLFVGISKKFFFDGIKTENSKKHLKCYKKMAFYLLLAGVAYVAYSGISIFFPKHDKYHMIVAIAIAAVSFCDIALAIVNVVKVRKLNNLLMTGIKQVSLATALVSVVLTQVALLSFSSENDNCLFNSLMGLLLGLVSVGIATYMLLYAKSIATQDDAQREQLQQG